MTLHKRAREAANRIYGHLYRCYTPFGPNNCVYCGDPCDTMDHCPPLATVFANGAEFFRKKGVELFTVPACRECNTALGSRPIFHINARRDFIRQKYIKRYSKFVEQRGWTAEEKAELGFNLRDIVEKADGQRARIKRRLQFLGCSIYKDAA